MTHITETRKKTKSNVDLNYSDKGLVRDGVHAVEWERGHWHKILEKSLNSNYKRPKTPLYEWRIFQNVIPTFYHFLCIVQGLILLLSQTQERLIMCVCVCVWFEQFTFQFLSNSEIIALLFWFRAADEVAVKLLTRAVVFSRLELVRIQFWAPVPGCWQPQVLCGFDILILWDSS